MGSYATTVERQAQKIREFMRTARAGRRVPAQQLLVCLNSIDNSVMPLIQMVARVNNRTFTPPKVSLKQVLGRYLDSKGLMIQGNTIRAYAALLKEVRDLERILSKGASRNDPAVDRPLREAYKLCAALREYVVYAVEVFATAALPHSRLEAQGEVQFHTVDAPLFRTQTGNRRAIVPEDVNQGTVGNCYFMATLAAAAQSCPQEIRRMIQDHRDGTYTVTFQVMDGNRRVAKKIKVDNRLASASGKYPYGRPYQVKKPEELELWPVIIEKAYAKLCKGYESTATGLPSSSLGLMGMTNEWEQNYFNTKSEADYKRLIKDAILRKQPIVFATWGHCLAFKELRNGQPVLYDPHGHEQSYTWRALCEEIWQVWVGKPGTARGR